MNGQGFGDKRFTSVPGISDRRRMPRLGKIRLGAKAKTQNGKEYPVELPFFLLPDDLAPVYGMKERALERAKEIGETREKILDFISKNGHRLAEELPVMLPINDMSVVFPQAYKRWGKGRGLKCIGNGIEAVEMGFDKDGVPTGEKTEKPCPCPLLEKKECAFQGNLMVMLYKVNPAGIYQIDTGSKDNSVVDILSALELAQMQIGRFAMIPMVLRRSLRITHGSGKEERHYPMQLFHKVPVEQIEAYRANTSMILARQETIMLPGPDERQRDDAEEPEEVVIDAEAEQPQPEDPAIEGEMEEDDSEPIEIRVARADMAEFQTLEALRAYYEGDLMAKVDHPLHNEFLKLKDKRKKDIELALSLDKGR